jgi:hypothetical protein
MTLAPILAVVRTSVNPNKPNHTGSRYPPSTAAANTRPPRRRGCPMQAQNSQIWTASDLIRMARTSVQRRI